MRLCMRQVPEASPALVGSQMELDQLKTAEDTEDTEEKDENLCVLSVLCGFHLVLKSALIRVNPRRRN